MAPPRKRALPKPLPDGFILTDTEKKTWRLGKIIGQGGFGLIYLASQEVDRPVAADTDFVIKVEYHENGPLFSELKFYQRAAKPESMQRWVRSRKLDFLGIPNYWGSGLAEHNGLRYRFMAMDRLGTDLQKVVERNGGRLKKATVLQLGRGLVDVLEYIHDNEYVHADIKAANLMLGHRDPEKVYLADYGLSYRFCPDGVHKEYKENPKKGHNGTIEYTSLDAHRGVAPSRRGDLQILGFCLLHWLCGSLPWDDVLNNPTEVQEAKTRLMDNLPGSVQQLSASRASTDEVARFLLYVKSLGHQDRPDYQRLKDLLASSDKGRLDFSRPQEEPAGKSTTKIPDHPARGKKAERARGSSKPRPESVEEHDEEEGEETKPRHVPARYIRGPPLPKPQPQQAGKARSPRPKAEPVEVDTDDDDSQDDDDDDTEEEEARPKPIASCYLRGPPIGPRPQNKEAKTKSKRTVKKTDADLAATSERLEVKRRLHPLRKTPTAIHSDLRSQKHIDYWKDGTDCNSTNKAVHVYTVQNKSSGHCQFEKINDSNCPLQQKTDVDLAATSARQEAKRRLHPLSKTPTAIHSDLRSQKHIDCKERWDGLRFNHSEGFSPTHSGDHGGWWGSDHGDQWDEHRRCFCQCERSLLKGPREEPVPKRSNGLFYWSVFMGFFFFLVAAVAFK